MIAVKLSSKKRNASASSSETPDLKEPTLVRLGKRAVQKGTCEMLCTIVGLLHADPSLDLSIIVPALFRTELHVFIRFSEYPAVVNSWVCVAYARICGVCHMR